RLITREAAARQLALEPVEDFLAHPGAGVTARTAADEVLVGTRRLLEEKGVAIPPEAVVLLEAFDAMGQTTLLVARAGSVLGFLGDGINDAPALARADVGLAIGGTGTDVAAEAGDVVFMGDPLRHLPLLVRLSRETVRVIRQNILIFAFGVNGVGILLTAWLWP